MKRVIVLGVVLGLAACGANVDQSNRPRPVSIEHKPPPDERDGTAVSGTTGVLDDDEVRTVMHEHMAGFNNCFRHGAGSFVSGKVLLQFVVNQVGRVDQVYVFESDVGSWRIEDCLVQTARYLEFPHPGGGGGARFAFPLSYNEPGRRLSVPVDRAWGYTTLRKNRDPIRRCRNKHHFEGPFNLTIYVGRLGKVLSAGFDSPTQPGDAFPACVVEIVEALRFPNPGQKVVKYRALVEDLPGA